MFKVFLLILFGQVFCELDRLEGWNYINLHCRDNDNKPLDWWYIYKPPSDEPLTIMETGKNFSFITPNSNGKWEQSPDYITTDTMLKHTLSPIFRETYSDHLAVLAYHSMKGRGESMGCYGHGIMMADEKGGVWLGHTVPGFPDLLTDRVTFPENEVPNGHMFLCLSLDLVTLNAFATSLKIMQPNVTRLVIPHSIRTNLPSWASFHETSADENPAHSMMKLDFSTTSRTVRGSIVVRRPGENRCLYKAFAKSNSIVLDVYGHDPHFKNTCLEDYSVRSIDSISLKLSDTGVYYIDNRTDHAGFAVSTAAHWQRSGGKKEQYWTCTSSPEKEDIALRRGKGGLMVCIEDYNVWRSFDMLKVKEPEC